MPTLHPAYVLRQYTPENRQRFEEILARYPVKRSALLPALTLAQALGFSTLAALARATLPDREYHGEDISRLLTGEGKVDHLDLNFGCPAAKVTRRGGGAAVPARPELLRAILRAAAHGNVRILIPLISGIDEVEQALRLLGRFVDRVGLVLFGVVLGDRFVVVDPVFADWICERVGF